MKEEKGKREGGERWRKKGSEIGRAGKNGEKKKGKERGKGFLFVIFDRQGINSCNVCV
jgi:hypothetical protein